MSLADRCIHQFDSGLRRRGEQYFREHRVTVRSPGPSDVRAFVQGESEYEVVLDWGFSREQLAVCCTCPYYDDHAVCKHIWATILAADAANIGPRGKGRLGILPMAPDDYDADDDDSWIDDYDDDDDDDDPRPPRGKAGSRSSDPGRKSGRNAPPPKPKWQQQLTWAAARPSRKIPSGRSPLLCRRRAKSGMFSTRPLSGDAGKLVLLLLQRETKANGQFGKLKQLNLRPYELGRLVPAEDAEILNLLLGYHDVESHDYYYDYPSSRVSEAVLPKNMQQFLLPKLAATQRLARAETDAGYHVQPGFNDLRPLAWDDGPPWRFRLDIQSDDVRQRWTLSGQLFRPGSDETLSVQFAADDLQAGPRAPGRSARAAGGRRFGADDRGLAENPRGRSALQ